MNRFGAALIIGACSFAVLGAVSRHTPASIELPYFENRTLTPHFAADSFELGRAHTIGEFHFTDQSGADISARDVAGRLYVASFFYTECRNLCPDLRTQLARVHDAYRGDSNVLILSHSVKPVEDDVTRLAHYAKLNGIDGRQWKLLTGQRTELERLARDRYFVELADTTGNTRGRLRHTETLVLVDAAGHIRGVYDGSLAFEVTQLIADIATLRDRRG